MNDSDGSSPLLSLQWMESLGTPCEPLPGRSSLFLPAIQGECLTYHVGSQSQCMAATVEKWFNNIHFLSLFVCSYVKEGNSFYLLTGLQSISLMPPWPSNHNCIVSLVSGPLYVLKMFSSLAPSLKTESLFIFLGKALPSSYHIPSDIARWYLFSGFPQPLCLPPSQQ